MRVSSCLVSCASLFALGSLAFDSTPAAPSVAIGFTKQSFAKVNGRVFDLDGEPTYFAGTNAWWLPYMTEESDVDLVLSEIAGSGLKVVRIWAFGTVNTVPTDDSTWFQLLNSTGWYYNYGPNGIPRLDYVVHAAEKYGLKLVTPMQNNWNSLGGIPTYNAAFGGNETSWYTDVQSQKAYRNYVRLIVNRYKNSPAIFAHELMNEPRCRGCPTSVITNWAADISKLIKSIDSKHMVTLGDEGWFGPGDGVGDGSYGYGGYEGVDWAANLGIPTLDYGTFHMYPDQWGYNYTWGSTWIQQHNAVGAKFSKPVVLEEYGAPFPFNHTAITAPWQKTILKNTQIAYDSLWQFGTNTAEGVTYYDPYAIFYNTSEYQNLVVQHAKKMLAKKVTKAVLS